MGVSGKMDSRRPAADSAPITYLLYEQPETPARVEALLASRSIKLAAIVREANQLANAGDVDLLIVEALSRHEVLEAQVRSFAALLPDALLIIIVAEGGAAIEKALRDAGALDVVEHGPDLERQLARGVAFSIRFRKLKERQVALSADLAHRERLNSLGLLAASVGHEINNPCAVILSNATSVREDLEALRSRPRHQMIDELHEKSDDWVDALGDVMGASRRIASIVSTLGVFSRKAAETPPEPVQLNEAVSAVLRFVGKEVRLQAEIDLDLTPDLPPVLVASHALMQVLTNLVVNALQALAQGSSGPPRLRIRTSADESTVLLEVSDNGPGIPSDVIGRVFDPFFTTKLGVGSGLGLSITRELVLGAGGDIFVESEPRNGAAFRVILPAHGVITGGVRPASVPPQARRLRVMILDDDDMMLRSMARSLRGRFECIPVRSVEAARASLERDDRIDAVLADVVMPGSGGFDLYQELLRDRPALASRTAFFSGGITSDELRNALEETGQPVLLKPVEVDRCVEVLRSLVSR
jgi:two-component system, NtrC family, sensor kinase